MRRQGKLQMEKLKDHIPLLQKFQNKVKLDVGGQIFCTTIEVLTRSESFFSSMFSGKYGVEQDLYDGSYYIDRSPQFFDLILEFMRTGNIRSVKKLDKDDKELLRIEAEYFAYTNLLQYLGDGFVLWEPNFELLEGNVQAVKNEDDEGFTVTIPGSTACSMLDISFPENTKTILEINYTDCNGCYGFISFLGNDTKPLRGQTYNCLCVYMGSPDRNNGLFRGTQALSSSYNPSSTGTAVSGPDGVTGQIHQFIIDTSEKTMTWVTGGTSRGSTPLPQGEHLWLNVGMWCCSRYSFKMKWSHE
jgi:hypothetical protein